jgi:DNA polymerase-3 subunit epsilon
MMMGRVRWIEVRETAGELGALLLESKLIKELKPMFNRAQRQRRRIVIAERRMTPQGYLTVHLRSVDAIDPRKSGEILGVFKHTTQAKEFLEQAVKERRLCPVLLGLEQGRRAGELVTRESFIGHRESSIVNRQSKIHQLRPCFSYHLDRCAGACIGEEQPEAYNPRVEQAFEERRIVAWPYRGGLMIREKREVGGGTRGKVAREELFLVDNWVLVGSLTRTGSRIAPFVATSHRFDYDTYKILRAFVDDPRSPVSIKVVTRAEWRDLVGSTAGQSPPSA